jgi:hypothetical protein
MNLPIKVGELEPMASRVTMIDRCQKIKECTSVSELGATIKLYPDIILSKDGYATLMATIPDIIHSSNAIYLNFNFISAIVDTHRRHTKGMLSDEKFVDTLYSQDGWSTPDYALDILYYYIRTMVEYTKGMCLERTNLMVEYPFNDPHFDERCVSPLQYVGFIMLLAKWEPNEPITKAVHNFVVCGFSNRDLIQAFLEVLGESVGTPKCDAQAAYYISKLWSKYCGSKDHNWMTMGEFVYRCSEKDIGWLVEHSNEVTEEGAEMHAHDLEACTDLFMVLSNVFTNPFMRENYFFEYIAMISYYYPLSVQRHNIAEKYSYYFKDHTMIYMADFTNEILQAFSKEQVSYRGTHFEDKMVEHSIHTKAEAIILDMHREYPDVPARVIENFFDATCHAFGRGFNGAAPGVMLLISPMIYEIIGEDKKTLESDLDCFGLFQALESSYGDDPMPQTTGTNTEAADDRTYEPSTHERANVKSGATANMKDAERKIYNAYHKYKNGEQKVDETLNKGIGVLKKAVVGDQQQIIIEGKKFSAIGFLKKALATIAIFNYNKIAAILFIIVSQVMKKKTRRSEKRKILEELEAELTMVNEKIEDARGDGNREAKYDLMRTRNALQNAIKRIKYGMGAEEKEGLKDAERIKSSLQQQRTNAASSYSG